MRDLLGIVLGLVALYVVGVAIGRVSQLRHGPGYLAVAAFVALIVVMVAWGARSGGRGGGSGHDPADVGDVGAAGQDHLGPGLGHD